MAGISISRETEATLIWLFRALVITLLFGIYLNNGYPNAEYAVLDAVVLVIIAVVVLTYLTIPMVKVVNHTWR